MIFKPIEFVDDGAVGPRRGAIDAGDIGQPISTSGRVAQTAAARAHVLEIAADEVSLS
jgi:hypothetical protein